MLTSNCLHCGAEFKFYKSASSGKFCGKDCDIAYKALRKKCQDCGHERCKEHSRIKTANWRKKAEKKELKARSMQVLFRSASDRTMSLSLDEARKIIEEGRVCPYCNKPIPWQNLSIDHKLPKSRGGSNDLDNLVWVDLSCNMMKGNLTDVEFLDLLGYLKEKPKIYEYLSTRLKAGGFMFKRGRRSF